MLYHVPCMTLCHLLKFQSRKHLLYIIILEIWKCHEEHLLYTLDQSIFYSHFYVSTCFYTCRTVEMARRSIWYLGLRNTWSIFAILTGLSFVRIQWLNFVQLSFYFPSFLRMSISGIMIFNFLHLTWLSIYSFNVLFFLVINLG